MTDKNRVKPRILHTSDLQVRSLDDEGCYNLEMIVGLAIKTKVDLVIIAGDSFCRY